jgi:hypothetical protein
VAISAELWSSYSHNSANIRRQAVSAANGQLVGARKCRTVALEERGRALAVTAFGGRRAGVSPVFEAGSCVSRR